MADISAILSEISHRPYELPVGEWRYYQEWNRALFMHWKIPFETLRKHVPAQLNIDRFNGDCYISLVAFTMQKIRPKHLPALRFISDFHEINLRTYIDNGGRKGVYFINIEAGKPLSAFVAKQFSGLPYEPAMIKRDERIYSSSNVAKNFTLHAEFEVKEKLSQKTESDKWLTERYCLYMDVKGELFRYDIHHKEWELKEVNIKQLRIHYKIEELVLPESAAEIAHYSEGVQVLAWRKTKVA